MSFTIVLNQVLILFVLLIVGAVAGKTGVIADGATKKLSELLLYVTSPLLVLRSFFFEYSAEKLKNGLLVLLLACVFFLFTIFISALLYKKYDDKVKPIMRFTAVFSNCGFMGLPLMDALFGLEGVFLGSFYLVAFNLFIWTFGFTLFSNIKGKDGMKTALKRALLSPAMVCIYTGIIIFVFRIPVPGFIESAVGYIGNMTLPLSMLIVGALISSTQIKELLNDYKVYYASAVRLIGIPLLAYGILYFTNLPWMPVAVVVTALAMPIAANTTFFSEMFEKDAVFASKAVAMSTIFSVITAPLLISLLFR